MIPCNCFTEDRWPEAEYFRSTSQKSKLNLNFIQLAKLDQSNKDPTAPILGAMEQIEDFKAEVILLYANIENVEVMLQQVTYVLDLMVLYLFEEMFSVILSY